MNTVKVQEYLKLNNTSKFFIRRIFYEGESNKCCRLCDSMIEGFCYKSKTWCTNIPPDNKECFRIRNSWSDFLDKFDKEDFN